MKHFSRLQIAAMTLAVVASVVPATSHAAPVSFTTPSVLKSGLRSVASAILSQTVKGSFLAQGQFVCDTGSNSYCGLVSGRRGIYIPEPSTYTATGGNVKVGSGPTATAKYEAVRTVSGFNSSASTRGLRTGSSVTLYAVLDVVTNNTGVSYDCVLKHSGVTGTGTAKVTLFNNVTATGTYIYSTPFVKGPNDIGSCGTLGTPKANSSVSLLFLTLDALAGK